MEINLEVLQAKKDELLKNVDQLKANLQASNGAIQILDHLMDLAKAEFVSLEQKAKEELKKLEGK